MAPRTAFLVLAAAALAALVGCAPAQQPTGLAESPAAPEGPTASSCTDIITVLGPMQPSPTVTSEIDFESTITLPAGIMLPIPDCAIQMVNPATNGGFNVMAFYLDPDPAMLERLDSELRSAGYDAVGASWYLADAEGTTFTISPGSTSLILPVLSTTGDVVLVGVTPGEPGEQEAPPPSGGSPTCDEARPIFGHFDANADAAWASFADRYFDGSESAADAWAYEECSLSYE